MTIRGKTIQVDKEDMAFTDPFVLALFALNKPEIDEILRAYGVHFQGYLGELEEVLYPKEA